MAGLVGEGTMGLGEERRRAGDEDADMGGRLPVEAGMLEEAGVEGRNAHHRRRLGQAAHHLVGVEFREEDHGAAGQQKGVGRREEAVGVIDGKGVKEDVAVGETPGLDESKRIRGEVAVGQHRALGTPGGAGGVEDGDEIVPADRGVGEIGALGRHRFHERAVAGGAEGERRGDAVATAEGTDLVAARRSRDDHFRFGVADEIVEFGERIGGVQGQVDRAEAERRQGRA